MKTYEKGSAEDIEIMSSFKNNGNHVIRYSSNELSGIWSDLTIEQTLWRLQSTKVVFQVVVLHGSVGKKGMDSNIRYVID